MHLTRGINHKKLEIFLNKIKEKEFIKIVKNKLPYKNYKSKKKFTYIFFNKNDDYIASVVILNTSYSNHLFFLYILKKYRSKGIGKMFLKIFESTSKDKIKTVHVNKNLKKTIKFYLNNGFKNNTDNQNKSLIKWKQRCKKRNKYHFNTRALLFKLIR